jgi:hypothetical protein
VKNDGSGHLSGYAWAENAGWISFSCQNSPSTCANTGNYGVIIGDYDVNVEHAGAGAFTGYAWGENIGWISFSCKNNPTACASNGNFQMQTGAPDSDGDGYTDGQEATLVKDPFTYCPIMRADIDASGRVVLADLAGIGKLFNQTLPVNSTRADQDGDGKIRIADLALVGKVFNQPVSACP